MTDTATRDAELIRLATTTGLTVRELAARVGLSRFTVYHIMADNGYERAWFWRKKEQPQ